MDDARKTLDSQSPQLTTAVGPSRPMPVPPDPVVLKHGADVEISFSSPGFRKQMAFKYSLEPSIVI